MRFDIDIDMEKLENSQTEQYKSVWMPVTIRLLQLKRH